MTLNRNPSSSWQQQILEFLITTLLSHTVMKVGKALRKCLVNHHPPKAGPNQCHIRLYRICCSWMSDLINVTLHCSREYITLMSFGLRPPVSAFSTRTIIGRPHFGTEGNYMSWAWNLGQSTGVHSPKYHIEKIFLQTVPQGTQKNNSGTPRSSSHTDD